MSELPAGTVTFLFSDIEGSTRLAQEVGDAFPGLIVEHQTIVRSEIGARGGIELGTEGDSFFVVFPSALSAVSAALDVQRRLQAETDFKVRMGLHSGEAAVRGGSYYGLEVHRAARIAAAGHGGQVLISNATMALVSQQLPEGTIATDLGEHMLKDLASPEHLYQLTATGLPAEFPVLRTLEPEHHNIPPAPTPLVGRRGQLGELAELVGAKKLITLTGPGGVGKTRLALQLGLESQAKFVDGVWLVQLATIADPKHVVHEIAIALNVQVTSSADVVATVAESLGPKELLLILDNFEQVIDAAPDIATLLTKARGLHMIVTSRERLNVIGEQQWEVPPLTTPEPAAEISADDLDGYEATLLFLQQARAVKPSFRPTDDDARFIADVCNRLDGIPLAIELAASRLRMMTPAALSSRIDDRLAILTGGSRNLPDRQQTLRAAIDWSYQLLELDERTMLADLSVFRGGRSLEAIEAVCGPDLDGSALDAVASLVDKSLVREESSPGGESRFVMMESIHDFATERLDESGRTTELRQRHAEYFTTLATQGITLGATRHVNTEHINTLNLEVENLRHSLRWLFDSGQDEAGARVVSGVAEAWGFESHLQDVAEWARRALVNENDLTDATRALLYDRLGLATFLQSDLIAARSWWQKAHDLYAQIGDHDGVSYSLINIAASYLGDMDGYEVAIDMLERGLGGLRASSDGFDDTQPLIVRGELHRVAGDFDAARSAYEEGLAKARTAGAQRRQIVLLVNLGTLAQHRNDPGHALELISESIVIARASGSAAWTATGIRYAAPPITDLGYPEDGARLLGAAQRWEQRLNVIHQPNDVEVVERGRQTVAAGLSADDLERLMAEGAQMTLDEAVDLATRDRATREV